MKKIIFTFLLLLPLLSSARHPYYPEKYQNLFYSGSLYNQELKGILFYILSAPHQLNGNKADSLSCDDKNKVCYGHLNLGYRGARRVLFGEIHLQEDNNGYFIEDVYCQKIITKTDGVGPKKIPNHKILNCEHTWPQARFSNKFSANQQKSDLHHLYPTDSQANNIRGHAEFANLNHGSPLQNCEASRTEGRSGRFEPPNNHKGNVARSIFYFSVRYQLKISSEEEETLRSWHLLDPVDVAEMRRNEIIYRAQHNRNPFIDWPELVNYINNF